MAARTCTCSTMIFPGGNSIHEHGCDLLRSLAPDGCTCIRVAEGNDRIVHNYECEVRREKLARIDRSDPSVAVDSSSSPAERIEVHAHGRALTLSRDEAEQLLADLERALRPMRDPHGAGCLCSRCV